MLIYNYLQEANFTKKWCFTPVSDKCEKKLFERAWITPNKTQNHRPENDLKTGLRWILMCCFLASNKHIWIPATIVQCFNKVAQTFEANV